MPADDAYPILSGDDETWPQCTHCKRSCGEPDEFVQLDVGPILHSDTARTEGGPHALMSAYFSLIKHGAEPHGPFTRLDIVSEVVGGQADLMFCSTDCLREFFMAAIDELEDRWRRDVSSSPSSTD